MNKYSMYIFLLFLLSSLTIITSDTPKYYKIVPKNNNTLELTGNLVTDINRNIFFITSTKAFIKEDRFFKEIPKTPIVIPLKRNETLTTRTIHLQLILTK
ncbi:MAG: hypothetical protein CL947_01060 [Epsilonproteobacteria bacterium]|nr:hypothetical protein [Campylobacterota bacterium]